MDKYLIPLKKRNTIEDSDDTDDEGTNKKCENDNIVEADNNIEPTSPSTKSFSYLLDGEFFSVLKEDRNKVTVKCELCKKVICGAKGSTGNYLSHITVSYSNC